MKPTPHGTRAFLKAAFVPWLLILGIAGHASVAMAQSPGMFTPTGNMTVARGRHAATLLRNGKVLITGGSPTPFNTALASAELYDPSTGTFTPTGNMTTARSQHAATVLPDGRVLIVGGSSLRKAELYDPKTGTFTTTGDMLAGGQRPAVLLANGKVLITGGPNAELYDPAMGVFALGRSYAGPIPVDLSNVTLNATLLPDGRVLITGVYSCMTPQLYDPATGTFSLANPMTGCDAENDYTAGVLLANGKVLFVGNIDSNYLPAAELFDSATGTFTPLTGAPVATASTVTLLSDATVLIAGGVLPGGSGDARAWFYDSTTGKFSFAGEMTTGRAVHAATLLSDGTVLITGGFGPRPPSVGLSTTEIFGLASAEIYKPSLLKPAPALLTVSGGAQQQGAILHAGTPRLASSIDPAAIGEYLEIYLSGLIGGSVIPPQVLIGGRMAEILWFGNTPGFVGLNQVNVQVPNGVAPGPAVPVHLTYLGRPSNAVTIGVQ